MALPRHGCQTCRKRRVKCDIVQPVCGRCALASRDCIWDPNNHHGLRFKNENAFAQGQPRRPNPTTVTATATVTTAPETPPNLEPSISIPVDVIAFSFYVRNYLLQPETDTFRALGHEYTAFVLPQWTLTQPGSGLHLAIHALSHAVFGREKRLQKALDLATAYYAQSIAKLQQEIQELQEGGLDALLITTMLLATYEDTMFENPQQHHHQGAITLLRLSYQTEGDARDSSIQRAVRWSIIKTCIFLATEVPDFLCDGAVYGEDKVLGLDRLLVQVACLGLRSKSAGLFINEDPKHSLDAQQLEKLSEEAKALDDALAAWPDADANANADGDEWKVVRLPIHPTLAPASSPTVRPYGDAVHRYQSHAHAAIWNTHRAVRIAVNSIRTRSLSHLLRQCSSPSHALILTEQLHLCRQRVDLSVRELRGSVPFFGDFSIAARKGFEELTTEKRLTLSDAKIVPMMAALLAWPLKVALSTEAAQGTQRQYLKSALETVAESLQDASLRSIVKQG